MKQTFSKQERLKSKRIIDDLFAAGKVIASPPVKVIWMETELPSESIAQFGVSVPKKRFKLAVERNKIKRKMREAIRLHKQELIESLGMKQKPIALMLMYTGKDIPEYSLLAEKISDAFNRLNEIA